MFLTVAFTVPAGLLLVNSTTLPGMMLSTLTKRGTQQISPLPVAPVKKMQHTQGGFGYAVKNTDRLAFNREMFQRKMAERKAAMQSTQAKTTRTKPKSAQAKPAAPMKKKMSVTYVQPPLHGAAPVQGVAAVIVAPTPTFTQTTDANFPAFGKAVYPVSKVPNWGAMRTPAEWNRTYAQMTDADFVPIPNYDLNVLTTPLDELKRNIFLSWAQSAITAKLFYSTRYFGTYDVDAGEFSGTHAGVDLKLPLGTPVGSIAGGRVTYVGSDDRLGLHVIVEHRHPSEGTLYSVYGHLGGVSVRANQDVLPGTVLGTVGMTGNTSGAHLHLQVDRDNGTYPHRQFLATEHISRSQADAYAINPIMLIRQNAYGVPQALTSNEMLP